MRGGVRGFEVQKRALKEGKGSVVDVRRARVGTRLCGVHPSPTGGCFNSMLAVTPGTPGSELKHLAQVSLYFQIGQPKMPPPGPSRRS